METNRTLIRTDKNGTRYYSFTCPCSKCNGRGYIDYYKHVEGGVCFDCNGTGIYEGTEKVYTDEYLAKKAEMAEKRESKRRAEWTLEKELAKMGYGPEIGLVINTRGEIDYGDDFKWLIQHADCEYRGGAVVTSVGNLQIAAAGYQILPVRWDELLDAEIPVSNKLADLIKPYMKGEGLLIPPIEIPMRSDKAVVALKIAVGIAGIEGGEVSHHKLRHSFASGLLRQGTNPRTVQELMRHSSIDTLFDHYAHVLRSDLADAVDRI